MHAKDNRTLLDMVKRRDNLSDSIRLMCEAFSWQELADLGLRAEAMIRYRNTWDVSLMEAKRAVEAYMDAV